jgi:hypothetical protein
MSDKPIPHSGELQASMAYMQIEELHFVIFLKQVAGYGIEALPSPHHIHLPPPKSCAALSRSEGNAP